VEPSHSTIHTKPCTIRQVRWSVPSAACPRCSSAAPRIWDVFRVAIDVDLEQPIVLSVEVSVHRCSPCGRVFRAQPPFLRRHAIYTRRVVQKAVEAVYRDGLAARRVPDRLARDFWVRPSEKMVRLWCRAFADELDFATDYQPWVIASFSGILCVDEVYQGELALLLAVDPAAPDGDRLVGYTLLTKKVDQAAVKSFLAELQAAGIKPDEVITDDSRLYPGVLAEIWPMAAHQLCLFHATRNVVKAVNAVVKQVRKAIPEPPPSTSPSLKGRFREEAPTSDQHDPASERYRWRQARRAAGIAQVHALSPQIQSARAIGRAIGVNHGTVRKWLKLTPSEPTTTIAELVATVGLMPPLEPPPAPWHDWDEVRRMREDLRLYRTLFLHQSGHLTAEEQHTLAELLAGPVGPPLKVARMFLEAWFAIWQDDDGQRRSSADAEPRYQAWHDDAAAAKVASLRRQQQHLDADHFTRLSAFLHNPVWEPTNNAAERGGRTFRHGQHPHFRLRSDKTISADIKVRAFLQKERFLSPQARRLHHCQRGRRPLRFTPEAPVRTPQR
jgi:transposase-like protein